MGNACNCQSYLPGTTNGKCLFQQLVRIRLSEQLFSSVFPPFPNDSLGKKPTPNCQSHYEKVQDAEKGCNYSNLHWKLNFQIRYGNYLFWKTGHILCIIIPSETFMAPTLMMFHTALQIWPFSQVLQKGDR